MGHSGHRGLDARPSKYCGLSILCRALSEWVPLSPTGVAEQFAITEATLSAWSSLDDEELHPENDPRDIVQLQGTPHTEWEPGWVGGESWRWMPPCHQRHCELRQAPPSLSLSFFI